MKVIRQLVHVTARFCISLVFLAGAANKILHWHDTERFLVNVLSEWQSYVGFSEQLQAGLSFLIPWAPVLVVLAILCELLGGLSVLLGIREKWGAGLLILFLIPTTALIHQFWFIEGSARDMQIAHFLKNLAIIGGLFMILLQENELPKIAFPPKF